MTVKNDNRPTGHIYVGPNTIPCTETGWFKAQNRIYENNIMQAFLCM